ncbi:Uncharacterised protein [Mycobacterium tuberculosis]|uniref:Uncharacterized protein n=1 Tax=Mycobacterium tuberculosis TaxID=1773 RepID=A0A916PC27_MYCTX|nr:Uncharacterised protein [Mycobacterium tuberculosis]
MHGAEMCDDGVGVGQHRLAFGDVEPVRLHLRAERLSQAHGFGQPVGVDIGKGKLCALLGEVECQRSADARAGPGDDGDLAFE